MVMNTRNILLIIILILVILFAILGAILGITYYRSNNPSSKSSGEIYCLTLDDMYFNLRDSKRIMKAIITIEANNENTIKSLEEKEFLIRDDINKIIRNKTEEDVEGSEGQTALKNEIKNSLVELFNDNSITNVYFNELVIQ